MNPVNATSFLTHEKVVWATGEISIADGHDACIISGSCRVVLAFATTAGHVNP